MSLKQRAKRIGANRTVLALAVARMGDAVGNSIMLVVLPLYVAVLPAPSVRVAETVRVGFLLAIYGVVATIVQPLSGMLSDHLRRHKLMIQLGLLAMAGSTLSFDFADSFLHLLLLRGVQGIGMALTVPAAMALLTMGTARETRGGSMGIYTTARMTGLALGPLIGGALHDLWGFSAAFFAGAGTIAAGMILVQLVVSDPPAARPAAPRQSRRHHGRGGMFHGPILALGIATAIMAAAFTMMATLEKQFNTRLHATAFAFSLAFSALMVTRLMFQLPLGRLSDRIGRKPLMIAGFVLLAPSTALLGAAGSTWELIGLRLLQGVAAAAIAAPSFALAGDLAHGGREAQQMSVVTAGFTLGVALGPLLAGGLAPILFHLPFIVGGVLCLLAAWIIYRYVPETVGAASRQSAA